MGNRWDPSNNGGILESQHFAQPNMTCYLQNPQAEVILNYKYFIFSAFHLKLFLCILFPLISVPLTFTKF